jgi:hypothetical protein
MVVVVTAFHARVPGTTAEFLLNLLHRLGKRDFCKSMSHNPAL